MAAGRERFGTVTLANGWENAKVASPWCEFSPRTKMFTSPNTANVTGASHRRKALLGGRAAKSRSTGCTWSAIVIRSTPWT